jgi:hypothetical protein
MLSDKGSRPPPIERGHHLGHDDGVVLLAPVGQQLDQDRADEALGTAALARQAPPPEPCVEDDLVRRNLQ